MTEKKKDTHNKDTKENETELLKKQLEKKDTLIKDYINHIKRAQADFENYKKRTEKERSESALKEVEKLITNLLPIIDNIERALEATKTNHNLDSLISGIKLTHKNLTGILKKEGLEPIECLSKQFDPNIHEALMTVETKEHKDETVCEVLEKGYIFKNRVIRPSKVKVAKNE